jgi:uncharacterized protein YecT (DUF1311 family)
MAQKDFEIANDQGTVRAIISCVSRGKQLAVSVESYESDGKASSLVIKVEQDSQGNLQRDPDGRLKFGTINAPIPLADYFVVDKYDNVASWNVRMSAVAADGETRTSAKDFDPKTDVARALIGMKVIVEGMAGPTSQMGLRRFWTEDNYQTVFGDGSAALVDPGKYLVTMLPLAIEASNSHGTFEIVVPTNDVNIDAVVRECRLPARAAPVGAIAAPTTATTTTSSSSGEGTAQRAEGTSADTGRPDVAAGAGASSPVKNADVVSSNAVASSPATSPPENAGVGLGPSFDCSKARSKAEHWICENADLAKEDAALSVAYGNRRAARPADVGKIKSEQRAFLVERDKCADVACVEQVYRRRTEELTNPPPN